MHLHAGTDFVRLHWAHHGATYFGTGLDGRWDAPDERYGVMYLGEDVEATFVEAVVRWPAGQGVLLSLVKNRRIARFRSKRPLQLAKLHGEAVSAFRLHPVDLAGDTYTKSQAASAIAFDDRQQLDGLRYRSRFDTDRYCVALFDRAADAVELISEGEEIDEDWVDDVLLKRGYRLLRI